MLKDSRHQQPDATTILRDNQFTVALIVKNPVFYGKTEHIKIKYHFIREAQERKEVELKHCSSEEQVADIFTKVLPKERFETLRDCLCVSNKSVKEE